MLIRLSVSIFVGGSSIFTKFLVHLSSADGQKEIDKFTQKPTYKFWCVLAFVFAPFISVCSIFVHVFSLLSCVW